MSDSYKFDGIIHVVSSLEVGGAERFVIDLCQLQSAKGASVAILSFGLISDPLVKECVSAEIKVFHTANSRIKKWKSALTAIRAYKVVHFHSPYPLKFMLPLMPLCLFKNIVYTRHGADPLAGKSWRWMHKIANLFVNRISFVSREGADIFTLSHGWSNKIKHVIDNGVNLAKVSINRKQSERFRIGSVGRMVALKNQISLLQALMFIEESVRRKIEIHFFGDGPSFAQLDEYVQKYTLQKQVIFHGMVSDRNKIYNSFDVLAVTSETEGLSLAIIEAMAYNCPILATDVGGNPKLVSHEKNGYLFDYNDVEALANYIEMLLGEGELFTNFSQQSRKKIEKQFSLLACSDKYHQLYEGSL